MVLNFKNFWAKERLPFPMLPSSWRSWGYQRAQPGLVSLICKLINPERTSFVRPMHSGRQCFSPLIITTLDTRQLGTTTLLYSVPTYPQFCFLWLQVSCGLKTLHGDLQKQTIHKFLTAQHSVWIYMMTSHTILFSPLQDMNCPFVQSNQVVHAPTFHH